MTTILYLYSFTIMVGIVKTTISSKGQITVPVQVRRALGLKAGSRLEVRLGQRGDFIVTKAAEKDFFGQFRGTCSRRSRWPNGDQAIRELRG
jgi:AbrB family looped-hinge helix DNA binding protein